MQFEVLFNLKFPSIFYFYVYLTKIQAKKLFKLERIIINSKKS